MTKMPKTTAPGGSLIMASDHISDFFAQYPGFPYDPNNEVWSEYHRLVRHVGWKPEGKKEKAANNAFRAALGRQFSYQYGTSDNKLENLQRLCQKLGVDPIPASVAACKKVIGKFHVNIIDFIDCERTGNPVHVFKTVRQLAAYTQREGKIFSKKQAKNNALLRFLLRSIFNH